MDAKNEMIIIKGEIKTSDVQSCKYNNATNKWDVEYNSGRVYSYGKHNVKVLDNPVELNPKFYKIVKDGRDFYNIDKIYKFSDSNTSYYHICFKKRGFNGDYCESDLKITESCFNDESSVNIFNYLKQISKFCKMGSDGDLLYSRYEKIDYVGDDTAIAKYLNPTKYKDSPVNNEFKPIFPFGCNNSQYKAVKRAMENQISVIQGPPGTGKTQTILNIIANILMQGKTVQVVSNNNSATDNVYDKLASEKYNLGFIAAKLGNSSNKERFLENQNLDYPDFSTWKNDNSSELRENIVSQSANIKDIFDKQEKLAELRQEISQLQIEQEYFNRHAKELNVNIDNIKFRTKLSSTQLMSLWQDIQIISDKQKQIGFWFKIKALIKYGITDFKSYKQDISDFIIIIQSMFYKAKYSEILNNIKDIEELLKSISDNNIKEFTDNSMIVFKDYLAQKYENRSRKRFTDKDLWLKSKEFLMDYPIVLSTTFSSRSSLNSNTVYDYLIIDEASQVDIATGSLAISCAKNVVIVGDNKQLANIVPPKLKPKVEDVFRKYNIDNGYKFTNSFLQSILDVLPNVPQTTLREHYRCHPKIIEFCNQKFYNGELIIMTKDNAEKDVLLVKKTRKGNHARDHYSKRQIDVIKQNIITEYSLDAEETGIISPYRNQVNALNDEIGQFEIDTVHKFQGREKDNIIISTVDDEISDFVDDPNLLNVAISRAKKRLMIVVTGNPQKKERIITELIDYINYNNFEVSDSNVCSVFDYLYSQYKDERDGYLKKHSKISMYDSENLMYSLIKDIIADNKFSSLGVICRIPLRMLIRNFDLLSAEEYKYAMNTSTHLDFLIYNKITKKPLLAIEVDGYEYHKEGTAQAERDKLKNNIMNTCHIKLLRFKTNGSGEKEKIISTLETLL